MEIREYAGSHDVQIIGPTTPGIMTVGQAKMGIMPNNMFSPGNIGVISRSGTLSYEVSINMARAGFGQSTVVGVGADPIIFTNMSEILRLFEKDTETEQILIVGEVGGKQEEKAAEYIPLGNKTCYFIYCRAQYAGRQENGTRRRYHAW